MGQLAESLGTTAPYLWEVLIRQAFVSCLIDIFEVFIFSMLSAISIFFWVKYGTKFWKWSEKDDMETFVIGAFIINSILLMIMFVVIFANIRTSLVKFINPEYWALKEILNIF